jgi:hypothetical protein
MDQWTARSVNLLVGKPVVTLVAVFTREGLLALWRTVSGSRRRKRRFAYFQRGGETDDGATMSDSTTGHELLSFLEVDAS